MHKKYFNTRSRLKQDNDFSCWTVVNQERDSAEEFPGIELDGWFSEECCYFDDTIIARGYADIFLYEYIPLMCIVLLFMGLTNIWE